MNPKINFDSSIIINTNKRFVNGKKKRNKRRGKKRATRSLGLFAVIGRALTRQTKHRLWSP